MVAKKKVTKSSKPTTSKKQSTKPVAKRPSRSSTSTTQFQAVLGFSVNKAGLTTVSFSSIPGCPSNVAQLAQTAGELLRKEAEHSGNVAVIMDGKTVYAKKA